MKVNDQNVEQGEVSEELGPYRLSVTDGQLRLDRPSMPCKGSQAFIPIPGKPKAATIAAESRAEPHTD